LESLYKFVPRKLFPEEYGGEAGPIQSNFQQSLKNFQYKNLIFLFRHNRDFFIEDENYGVDEKKRVGSPKNSESLFGVDGSFRQLMID
jgi:hypothetical protein